MDKLNMGKKNTFFLSHFVDGLTGFSQSVFIRLDSIIKLTHVHVFLWIVLKIVECRRFQERR